MSTRANIQQENSQCKNTNKEEFQHILEHGWTIPRTQLNSKKEIHQNPLIEDIIENPPHDAIEYLKCHQYYLSEEDDHNGTKYLPKEETISEAYSETHDEICNEHNDDSLEVLLPCDLVF